MFQGLRGGKNTLDRAPPPFAGSTARVGFHPSHLLCVRPAASRVVWPRLLGLPQGCTDPPVVAVTDAFARAALLCADCPPCLGLDSPLLVGSVLVCLRLSPFLCPPLRALLLGVCV